MSAFIGRSNELQTLDAALEAAAGGAGRSVIISGEAGIGKSRLVREAQRRARGKGFVTLVARCEQPDGAVAFAALTGLLRDTLRGLCAEAVVAQLGTLAGRLAPLLPELSEVAPVAAGTKEALCEALGDWLAQRAAEQPLLMTMEDVHWSDDASLSCLAALCGRMSGLRHVILLTFRTPLAAGELERFMQHVASRTEVQHLKLQPLSRQEVDLVMRSVTGASQPVPFYFLTRVFDVTRGNPLFVEELCLSSTATDAVSGETDLLGLHPRPQAAIPRSVRRIIRQRIQAVGRQAQTVADLCAVHGRAFDLELVQAITGYSNERLANLCEELVQAYLALHTAPGQFAFRHALLQESLYDRLLVRERRAIHEQLACAIEEVYADSLQEHLADLSYHAFKAACWGRALPYCRLAAEQALALGAPRAAAAQLTRAIEAANWLTGAPSWALHCERAKAFEQLGELDGALTDYATALDSARVLGDAAAEAAVLRKLAAFLPLLTLAHAGEYYGEIVRQMEKGEEVSLGDVPLQDASL